LLRAQRRAVLLLSLLLWNHFVVPVLVVGVVGGENISIEGGLERILAFSISLDFWLRLFLNAAAQLS